MDLALPDPDQYDLVILPGDIHSHTHAIPWAAQPFVKPVIYATGSRPLLSLAMWMGSVRNSALTGQRPKIEGHSNS
jgi:hypothetical protein